MKKFWTLLLAMCLLLSFVSCDKTPAESETIPETIPETTLDTQPETLPEQTQAETTPEVLDAAYILDKILDSKKTMFPQGDYAMNMDMGFEFKTNQNGMNATVSTTTSMKYVVDVDGGTQIRMTIPNSDPVELIYVSDTIYVEKDGERYYSAIAKEDFDMLAAELVGNMGSMDMPMGGLGDIGDMTSTLQVMLGMIKPSALFGEVSAEVGENNTYVVNAKGLSEQLKTLLGNLGGSDAESDMDVDMLETIIPFDQVTLTFVSDKDYAIQSIALVTPMDLGFLMGAEDGQMVANLSLTYNISREDQTVTAPANKENYTELDWHWIFDMPTADMLLLTPDKNNCIALSSDDLPLYDYQIAYIAEHPQEFAGVTFTWEAIYSGTMDFTMGELMDTDDDTTITFMFAYMEQSVDLEEWYSDLTVYVPAEKLAGLTMEEGSVVVVTFTLMQGDMAEMLSYAGAIFQLVECSAK